MAKNGLSVRRRWQLAALCAVGWGRAARRHGRIYACLRSIPETGDIETSMSLSGEIELVNSESFAAPERTTVQGV